MRKEEGRPAVNVYCDESCHLEHDHLPVMTLGALWSPLADVRASAARLREIKEKHGLPRAFEVKWTKVSRGKEGFYLDVVDYFFDSDSLHFRAVVIPDKSQLRHQDFDQDQDTWYYKMYSILLTYLFNPQNQYNVYLDMKDSRSQRKVEKLHRVLCSSHRDFDRHIVRKIQQVRSDEVEQVQLADLLIGAVGYANRELQGNRGKEAVVERVRARSGYSLVRTTLLAEEKMNILRWRARGPEE